MPLRCLITLTALILFTTAHADEPPTANPTLTGQAAKNNPKIVKRPTGDLFLTCFVTKDGNVWGRPVAVAKDAAGTVWRAAYTGKK